MGKFSENFVENLVRLRKSKNLISKSLRINLKSINNNFQNLNEEEERLTLKC